MITDDNYWEDPVGLFIYDVDNRRVRRVDVGDLEEGSSRPSDITEYAYAGWRVLEETHHANAYYEDYTPIEIALYGTTGFRQNLYGNYLDEVIAVQIDGDNDGQAHESVHDENSATGPDHRYYYCHNTLYSVVAITDEDADLVERYAYDPYGQTHIYNTAGTKIANSTIGNVFTFTGQRFDPEYEDGTLPLYLYYKNRYYHITQGRFISRDPIGYDGGLNSFHYAHNDPLTNIDHLGLDAQNPNSGFSDEKCDRLKRERKKRVDKILNQPGTSERDCENTNGCETVTIIIKLPDPCSINNMERKGLGGHTGIGIGDSYYDYGPYQEINKGGLGSVPGCPWRDDPIHWTNKSTDDVGLDDIMNNIDRLRGGLEVFEIKICMCESEAEKVKKYWDDLYKDFGNYSVSGNNCTTTVDESIRKGARNGCTDYCGLGITDYSPLALLEKIGRSKHGCGNLAKGRFVKVKKIR